MAGSSARQTAEVCLRGGQVDGPQAPLLRGSKGEATWEGSAMGIIQILQSGALAVYIPPLGPFPCPAAQTLHSICLAGGGAHSATNHFASHFCGEIERPRIGRGG